MFKVPMQNWFGAGLLLTLAFNVNDGSSAPGRSDPHAKVQFACDDGGFSRKNGATQNSEPDTAFCRETDFPQN